MGSADGNAAFDAVHPTVVYGPNATYFAVWSGDDDDAATDNEHEIYGQLIEAEAPPMPPANLNPVVWRTPTLLTNESE